jgi:hypothetical protein
MQLLIPGDVRICWRNGRERVYLIHISNCPGIGNGVLNWDVLPLEVAPTPGSVVGCPVIVQASIESGVVVFPSIVACNHALSSFWKVSSFIVKVPWQKVGGVRCESRVDGLLPDGLPIRVDLNVRVRESTNSCHSSEVVVECSILYAISATREG